MIRPALNGMKLVKLPVADVRTSLDWWRRVYDARQTMEFKNDDGSYHCIYLEVPGLDFEITLEPNTETGANLRGFNLLVFSVPTLADLEAWLTHLERLGIAHTGVFFGTTGWATRFSDADGIEHQLYTQQTHGRDLDGLPGRGHKLG